MHKIVFLDLEATVIDVFVEDGPSRLVNTARVRDFLAGEAPGSVRLFSFAMWHAQRVAQFQLLMEKELNQALRVSLDMHDTFTNETLFRLCRQRGTVFENADECMLFHSKDFGFQRFVELSPEFNDCELVLVDDAVCSKTIHIPGRRLTIRMVNVADLP